MQQPRLQQIDQLPDREAEQRLLPLAQERGIAVIANRPFREGALLRTLQRHPLPPWAATELGCDGWAQFVLKFIVSHPAVTCAIPATSSVAHVRQNMGAARGPLPDAALRLEGLALVERLRAAGLRCEWDLRGRSMKGMMRHAAGLGARRAVILGPREHEAGLATVRDMESGEQREVPLEGLVEALRP